MKKFLCSLPIILISLFLFTGCALTTAYKNIFPSASSSSTESSSSSQGGIKQKETSQSAPVDKQVAIVDDMDDLYTGVLHDYKGVLTQACCSTVNRMVKELGPIPMQNMWVNGRMELFMVRASLRRMLEENISGNGKMVTLGTETYTTKMGK